MIKFTKKEVLHLVLAILALGFVFGFDDKRPSFNLFYWLLNYFRVCLASAAVLLSYALVQKIVAEHYSCSSEFRLWSLQRFGFRPEYKAKRPFPVGIVLGILIAFLSAGKLPFAAFASFNIKEERYRRVGRKYINITALETAKVALSGVFAALLIAFILSALHLSKEIVLIASLFAFFQMIPLPHLDGAKVFFASMPLFAFSAAFIILSALLLNFVSAGPAFFYSFIGAGIFFIMFFYYRVYLS